MLTKRYTFYFILSVFLTLLVSCNTERDEELADGQRADLRVAFSGQPADDVELRDVRLMIFGESGIIEVNKKFAISQANPAQLSVLVGSSKRICAVANATGELDESLQRVFKYSELKSLLLSERTADNLESDLLSKVLTSEQVFDMTKAGNTLTLPLSRTYCKVVLYLYSPTDTKYPNIILKRAEFEHLASKSYLFPIRYNLTTNDLYTANKEWTTEQKIPHHDFTDPSKPVIDKVKELSENDIKPIVSYYPYEQYYLSQTTNPDASLLDLWSPKITIYATINGIDTKYYIPIKPSSLPSDIVPYCLKRNTQYLILGKVNNLGNETDGLTVNTTIVPWDDQHVDFTYKDSYMVDGSMSYQVGGNQPTSGPFPSHLEFKKGEKITLKFKVNAPNKGSYWNVSLSDGLYFTCSPVFGLADSNTEYSITISSPVDFPKSVSKRDFSIQFSVDGRPVYDKKEATRQSQDAPKPVRISISCSI